MNHRELYRGIVPDNSYIVTYSDLARASTCNSAKKIASEIYYKIGGSVSSEAQICGTKAHQIKELEIGDWDNEVTLSYKMADDYYLCGTIDRYGKTDHIITDFKTTASSSDKYLPTKQIETYAFLAMNNHLVVEGGEYTTISKDGDELSTTAVDISEATVAYCYATFILPRFNMIKKEIEELRNKYV